MARIKLVSLTSQPTLVVIGFALALCAAVTAFAQNDAVTTQPALEDLDNRLKIVQTTSALSEDQKNIITKYLETTRQALRSLLEYQKQARFYAEAQLTAAELTTALDVELKEFTHPPLPDPAQLSADALQSVHAEIRQMLREWKNREESIKAEIREELNIDLSRLLADTRQQYEEKSVQATPNEQSLQAQTAATEALAAEQAMLRARIDMLDQRLLSRRPRLDILGKQLDMLEQKIAVAEEQITKLNTSEFSKTREQVDEDIEKTESTANKTETVGGELVAHANLNVALAKELRQLVEKRETLARRSSEIRKRVDRLSDLFTGLSEQLKRPRIPRSPEFGAALLRQRTLLNSKVLTAREEAELDQELSELRLRQFELFEKSQAPWYIYEHDEPVSESADSAAQQLAETISVQRRKLMNQLITEYAQYDAQLSLIDGKTQRLKGLGDAFRKRVDQHMLWNVSIESFGITTLSAAFLSASKVIEMEYVLKSVSSIIRFYAHRPLLSLTIVFSIALILVLKRRHVLKLKEMLVWIGHVRHDRVRLTLHALWLTLLLSLPLPLLLAMPGILSLTIPDTDPQLLPAFMFPALLCFGFEFFRQSLREDGLAEAHFHWQADQTKLMRRKMRRYMPLFLFPAIITIVLHYLGTSEANASIGRIAYITAALIFASLSFSIIRTSVIAQSSGTRLHLLFFRYSIFLLGILLPAVFALLAFLGYQYAAEVLGASLLMSIGILIGFLLIFDFAIRAVAVFERQLALKRARALRAAAKSDTESEAGAVPIKTDEIDLQTISAQSNTLIKLIISILAAVSVWFVWSDLSLAFQPLQSFTLWQIKSEVDGVTSIQYITLWNLLATVSVLLITYLGVKNIPGTLEVLILSRMSLAPGMSYAITSTVTYVIVLTGIIIALQLIGAQWSKLQWLIAALGVGLGFGLQEIVANIVSGVMILFERPIRLGDTVTLGDQTGIVTRIRIRATTIMDWDRKEVLIPNKAFITERLINWTLTDPIMRLTVPVGVAYGSNVELVEQVLLEVAHNCSRVLREPESSVLFNDFGDNSLGFNLRVFVYGIQDVVPTRHDLHKAIEAKFRENSIEISFPQRDIHFDSGPLEISILDPKNTPQSGSPTEQDPK
ncbi:MAG: small-conductance mechanosensitive channel [Planctomycetota bacterium]